MASDWLIVPCREDVHDNRMEKGWHHARVYGSGLGADRIEQPHVKQDVLQTPASTLCSVHINCFVCCAEAACMAA